MHIQTTTLTAAAALLLTSLAAHAHATLEQKEAAAGVTTKITLRVPHGCDGEATEAVRIEIPEGFYAVKPMPKAGWTLTTEIGAYATPYDNHGREMTEGVRIVEWSGGQLEDGHYDEFVIRGAVGPDLETGARMFFPAVQTCATGTADWTDTSGSTGAPNPAPFLVVAAGDPEESHGHAHEAVEATMLGELELSDPFVRATLPGQPVAGGYLTVTNTGTQDDRLVAANTDFTDRTEIHEMAMDGDVMRMRELEDGLAIPAGETVTLAPGGYHLMFMELDGALEAGGSVDVTLTFERAGEVTLSMPVRARDGAGGDHAHHGSDG
jgi:uncharacterized protein YcnI